MAIRQRGRTFMADLMINKVRYRETFGTYEEAEKWEMEVRHSLKYGKELPAVKSKRANNSVQGIDTLGQLFDYVCRVHWERQANGGQTQIIAGRQIVQRLGKNKRVSEINRADLDALHSHFLERGNKPSTVNRKMAAMRKMLNVAVDHGVILKAPKVPKQRLAQDEVRFFTLSEEARIIERAKNLGLDDWSDFIQLAVDTGCRLGELLKMKWHNLSPELDKVHIWHTKSGKPRTIPLTARAQGVLKRRLEAFGDEAGPFVMWSTNGRTLVTTRRRQWGTLTQASGLQKRIHDLRHTCASRLVQRGVDLLRVKDWMGHTKIETTLIYAHLTPSNLELCRKALEQIGNAGDSQ